jgi:hypothetical protein
MMAYMPINLKTNDKNWNLQNLDSLIIMLLDLDHFRVPHNLH